MTFGLQTNNNSSKRKKNDVDDKTKTSVLALGK